ncbi:MAG: bacillithiol biosynthesis cysteine-adding enzyme BshC [Candidatus Zixiibacteriota bacterium]
MTVAKPEKTVAGTMKIPFSGALGLSRFHLDFSAGERSASELFPEQDMESLLERTDRISYPRSELAEILRRQNTRFGCKAGTFEMIDRLKDPRSVVVFAGQQAGLYGGPLLGFYKALWAVKTAASLSERLERPVIPVFWIAADDHDFEEINHTYVLDMIGEPLRLSYYRSEEEGLPAYQRLLSNPGLCAEVTQSLYDALGKTDFSEEVAERLCAAYQQGSDFVTAFGHFMADTLPDLGLILFSPGDSAFKKLSSGFYQTLLKNHSEVKSRMRAANERLLEAGYHLQVEKEDSACHMFMLNPQREPVHLDTGGYRASGARHTQAELQALIEAEPDRFSPDVITRPILAAFHFPTLAQSGGPSELAYFAQLSHIYEVFNRPAPVFSGRLSATLIEKRFEKLMKKHDLEFVDFTRDVEEVINQTLGKTFPDDLEQRFAKVRGEFREMFDPLASQVTAFDRSLEANAGQIWGKINNALENFEKKAFAAHKRKLADERAALYRAANSLFPGARFRSVRSVLSITFRATGTG